MFLRGPFDGATGLEKFRMVKLPVDTQRATQIEVPNPQAINAFNRGDGVNVFDPFLGLNKGNAGDAAIGSG